MAARRRSVLAPASFEPRRTGFAPGAAARIDLTGLPRSYRQPSARKKGEPLIRSGRRDLKDLGAHHTMSDKWIFLHPRLKIRQRRVVRENYAAQLRLKAAGHQENAIVEAALDPGVVAFHELTRLVLVA
jgi:hypothetical protein